MNYAEVQFLAAVYGNFKDKDVGMAEIRNKIIGLKNYLETKIIGQEELVRKLIITMLADGHALVEGAPGLAKTKAIKTLSECVTARYNAGFAAVGYYRE